MGTLLSISTFLSFSHRKMQRLVSALTCAFFLLLTHSLLPLPLSAETTRIIEDNFPPQEREPPFQVLDTQGLSGRIVFCGEEENKSQLFVLDLDSKKVRSLMTSQSNDTAPQLSPDGMKIVFVSDRDGGKELYLAEWNGDNPIRLTSAPGIKESPTWSPDGKKIYFTMISSKNPGVANIFSITAGGATLEQVTKFQGRTTSPHLSPDGEVLLYSSDRNWPGLDLCTVELGHMVENCVLTGAKSYFSGRWSPDGGSIVFTTGSVSPEDIGVFNLRVSARTSLAMSGDEERDPTWAPSNKTILYTYYSKDRARGGIVLAESEQVKRTLIGSRMRLTSPTWSPKRTMELEAQRLKTLMLNEAQENNTSATPVTEQHQ